MTFDSFWAGMLRQNKKLEDTDKKITITSSEFKRAMERAYFAGVDDAEDQSRNGSLDSFFNSIFGSGK